MPQGAPRFLRSTYETHERETMKPPRFAATPQFAAGLAGVAACFAGLSVWVINAGLSDGTTIGLVSLLYLACLSLLFLVGVCRSKQQPK